MPRRTIFHAIEDVIRKQLPRRYDIEGYEELLGKVPQSVLEETIAVLVCHPKAPASEVIDVGRWNLDYHDLALLKRLADDIAQFLDDSARIICFALPKNYHAAPQTPIHAVFYFPPANRQQHFLVKPIIVMKEDEDILNTMKVAVFLEYILLVQPWRKSIVVELHKAQILSHKQSIRFNE